MWPAGHHFDYQVLNYIHDEHENVTNISREVRCVDVTWTESEKRERRREAERKEGMKYRQWNVQQSGIQ
jgi:hypothetical protein